MNIISTVKYNRKPLNPKAEFFKKAARTNFDDEFDFKTIFCDCIRLNSNTVLFIGPPISNFIDGIKFISNGVELPYIHENLQRVSIFILKTTSDLIQVTLFDEIHNVKVSEMSNLFKDRSIISTMLRDEPIEWIKEWITYHNTIHGIDGFIIYNNLSTSYSSDELLNHLETLNLDIKIVVEDVPIPYGPVVEGWNDFYTQRVCITHMKHMYGWCARVVVNIDIDELLAFKDKDFNSAVKFMLDNKVALILDPTAIIPIETETGVNALDLEPKDIRFKNFYTTIRGYNLELSGTHKWMCIPHESWKYQWTTHGCGHATRNDGLIFHMRSHMSPNQNILLVKSLYEKIIKNIGGDSSLLKSYFDRIWK